MILLSIKYDVFKQNDLKVGADMLLFLEYFLYFERVYILLYFFILQIFLLIEFETRHL